MRMSLSIGRWIRTTSAGSPGGDPRTTDPYHPLFFYFCGLGGMDLGGDGSVGGETCGNSSCFSNLGGLV
jgi:hypothetical protein